MNRSNFILTAFAVFPLSIFPKIKLDFSVKSDKGFKINAGEGRILGHLKLKGVNINIIDVKVSGSDTNGELAIFEQTSLSQGKGTPLHIHHSQDEIFYVTDGAYYFQLGDEKIDSIETFDYGKFVPIMDEEGNKIELWEPIDSVFTEMGGKTTK